MTTISGSATINQTDIDGYSFPVTITGGTLGSPVIITFDEDLTISSSIGINGYFIIGSQYITINGQSYTVTITDIPDYPGLIQNGTFGSTASTNVYLENIGVVPNIFGSTTLAGSSGWLCQQYYGKSISSGTLLISNCYSTGTISGIDSGGICGATYGDSASGGIFTINNCYSTGIINGDSSGGICGAAYAVGATSGTFKIENCYSTGAIINGDSSGGICGESYGDSASGGTFTINNCYSTGNISQSYSGGICGESYGNGASGGIFTINNCYSIGNISSTSGGIIGPNCGIIATGGTINVNNSYTIGTFTVDNGIFGPNKILGTQTDCFASNGVSWSDATAQTYLTGTPTNINTNNPGTTWTTITSNTPYVLSSYDSQLYDPNNASSSTLPYATDSGLFQSDYTYQIVNNTQVSNIITTKVFVYRGTGPSYYDYNFNTFTFTNTGGSSTLASAINLSTGVITYPNTLTITKNPTSQTVAVGAQSVFKVTAVGTAPITYQWYKNNTLINGATTATLTLFDSTSSDNGSYYVIVKNGLTRRSTTATNFVLYPNPSKPPNPPNPVVNANSRYDQLYDQLYNQQYNQLYNQFYNQLYNQLYIQLNNAIQNNTINEKMVCYEVNYTKLNKLTINNKAFNTLLNNDYDKLYNQLYDIYYEPLYQSIYNLIYVPLYNNLYNALIKYKYDKNIIPDSCDSITLDPSYNTYKIYTQLELQLKNQLYNQLYTQLYNQFRNVLSK